MTRGASTRGSRRCPFTVEGTCDREAGYGLGATPEHASRIGTGDNPRDTVYILVENAQRVFRSQVG